MTSPYESFTKPIPAGEMDITGDEMHSRLELFFGNTRGTFHEICDPLDEIANLTLVDGGITQTPGKIRASAFLESLRLSFNPKLEEAPTVLPKPIQAFRNIFGISDNRLRVAKFETSSTEDHYVAYIPVRTLEESNNYGMDFAKALVFYIPYLDEADATLLPANIIKSNGDLDKFNFMYTNWYLPER